MKLTARLRLIKQTSNSDNPIQINVIQSLAEIDSDAWDALANPPQQPFDPFIAHAFLLALEQSGSVSTETGWVPVHLVAKDARGQIVGAMPLYLKSHSQGEYVFDHGWAAAFEQAGGNYYPKLQSSIPFTPVAGPRLLSPDPAVQSALIKAVQELTSRFGASSAHITFSQQPETKRFREAEWMQRKGLQFHFPNPGYADYEAFLATLTSRKRKALRSERRKANQGIDILRFTGDQLTSEHWDAFFGFYLDTGARKWGTPYLNRVFFELIGQSMAQHVLLIMARRDGQWVAGALNFIGGDCLYGRYWGCTEHHDSLHFELCYHRAIEAAIAMKLPRVEAGAQGAHKMARGYLPVLTNSWHHLPDPGFADAVGRFLEEETFEMKREQAACAALSPYRQSAAFTSEDDWPTVPQNDGEL